MQFLRRKEKSQYLCCYTFIAMNATTKSFGAGDGPIFLDLVGCTGTEENLLQCPNRGLEVHSCSHADDAGVQCVPGIIL